MFFDVKITIENSHTRTQIWLFCVKTPVLNTNMLFHFINHYLLLDRL